MKFRKPLKITSRSSSITNSFVQAIIPDVAPAIAEIEETLRILGMTAHNKTCVYCGVSATDWDHLRPLVRHKKPTGYLNEPRNIVPSCGPCNQSKSGADWQKWMQGKARGAPLSKGVKDVAERIARLQAFEAWGEVVPVIFEEMIPATEWQNYWMLLDQIQEKMKLAQIEADKIRAAITASLVNATDSKPQHN